MKLHVKRGNSSLFLLHMTCDSMVKDALDAICRIFRMILKVERLCRGLEDLSEHGIAFPPDMVGLTAQQIEELRLIDKWTPICVPSGGCELRADPIGKRNGHAPNEKMREVLKKAITDARHIVSPRQVEAGIVMTEKMAESALDIIRGAVMIVYPMGLPPHDLIQLELDSKEELQGPVAQDVIERTEGELWFSGKKLPEDQPLKAFLGTNEKTTAVVKVGKKGHGAPSREPVMSVEEQKQLMMHQFQKQEELKRLEADEDDNYLDSKWADGSSLKREYLGLSNITWKPH
ncbi:unnamed protein product [Darwinula stevensoni]|uniref:Cilia- and flagella-associated protein 298 n=1 Tax=Darwinula stevensoni TaxID=69355 RepID=A0A7R9A3X4_9CRUS|nr:unnamed protein product [Darwinula stevensoni]CAG0888852.1 unnamed protein product [Darwinula stevensoni]